jgi:orotidine-5'-phosphate decarboxylase
LKKYNILFLCKHNASRSIIYASNGADFAERARDEAMRIQHDMAIELDKINF